MVICMWGQRLKTLDKSVDRVGYWYGGWCLVTGVLSWVWKHVTVVNGIGWPEAILLGLASAIGFMVAFSACLAAWRYFMPLSKVSRNPDVYDNAELDYNQSDELTSLRDDLSRLVLQVDSINNNLGNTNQVIGRIIDDMKHLTEPLTNYVEGLKTATSETIADIDKEITRMSASLEEYSKKIDYQHGQFDAFKDVTKKQIKDTEEFKRRIVTILWAKQRIESLVPMYNEINDDGDHLYKIQDDSATQLGEDKWLSKFERWKNKITDYERIVQQIDPALPSALKTNAEEYRSDRWAFDRSMFSTEDMLHDYKSFCLMRRQFLALHHLVMEKLWVEASV